MTSIPIPSTQISADTHMAVRYWLYFLCVLVFAMVVVGGATRLTDSGLSITEWKPIVGIVPPLSDGDWQEVFVKYQQIPEYKRVNEGMSLAEFKTIFWWEWGHRFLGRLIGFAFLIPFLLFLALGKISKNLAPRLLMLFVLGALQGALGWYMVQSGLVDRVDVSQYRLAAHLGLAFIIFAAIFWVALGLRVVGLREKFDGANAEKLSAGLVGSAIFLTGLIFLQIILGAFVAGTHAGLSHNSWPLMDGAIIPDGLFVQSPWYVNLFENVATIQFNHRMLAYGVIIYTALHFLALFRASAAPGLQVSALLIFLSLIAQAALGIWTLLARVPIELGILHQAGAVIVFAIAVYHLRTCFFLEPRSA